MRVRGDRYFGFLCLSLIGGNVMSEIVIDRRPVCPGSARNASPARTSRAGFGVSPKRTLPWNWKNFRKPVMARRHHQHARRVRYPELYRDAREQIAICLLLFLATSDRKSTRLNSSHITISYAVFCLKKKNTHKISHE